MPEAEGPAITIDAADLTARFNALREVLQNQIRASQELLSARINGIDAERGILLEGLHRDRTSLEREIQNLRELQESLHSAMAAQTQMRADELAQKTDALAAAVQLQMDQRFTAAATGIQLIQEEIDQRLADLKALMDERHNAQVRSFEEQRDSALNSVQAALASAREAVNKAEAANEKRFEAVNEFRQTLTDQAASFPTRQEVSAQMAAIQATGSRNADNIKELELRVTSRLDTMAGQTGGAATFRSEHRLDVGQLVSLIVMVLIAAGLVVSVVAHK